MFQLFNREPALTMGVAQALIAVATIFGLKLTSEQASAVLVLTCAIAAWVIRQRVSPVAKGTK